MKSLNIIYMRVCIVPMTYDRSPQTLILLLGSPKVEAFLILGRPKP